MMLAKGIHTSERSLVVVVGGGWGWWLGVVVVGGGWCRRTG